MVQTHSDQGTAPITNGPETSESNPLLSRSTSKSISNDVKEVGENGFFTNNFFSNMENWNFCGMIENYFGIEFDLASILMIFCFPALGGLLFGYDIGASSHALLQLESSTYSGTTWYSNVSNSAVLQGFITSLGVGGAMIGSIICFYVGDTIGRRIELLIAAGLFLIGAIVEYMSGIEAFNVITGISILLTGRFTYGVGCGFAMHGAPAYIGEMAPPHIRGLLVAMKEAMIVLGMLLGYLCGWLLEYHIQGWRWMYGLSGFLAIVMGIGCYFLPYSARWLVLRGRYEEARLSLQWAMPNLSETEVKEILFSQSKDIETSDDHNDPSSKEKNSGRKTPGLGGSDSGSNEWQQLLNPIWRPAFIAGVGLVFLQQITGQPSILYYADTIFDDVGMADYSSTLIGLFKLLATLYAVFNVDQYGRKFLLYVGTSLMFVALIALGIAFSFQYMSLDDCNAITTESSCGDYSSQCTWDTSCSSSVCADDEDCTCCGVSGFNFQRSTILGSLFLYIGGYQVGFGPVVWLLIAELFPLNLKTKAISIAVVTNFFWNMVVTFSFSSEVDGIGANWTFFIFSILTAYSLYFIYVAVPETKGLTLEEIEEMFRRNANNRRLSMMSTGSA